MKAFLFLFPLSFAACAQGMNFEMPQYLMVIGRDKGAEERWADTAKRVPGDTKEANRLLHGLNGCDKREAVKFWPHYRITLVYADQSEKLILVLGDFIKVDGISYRCRDDIEKLLREFE